MTLRLSRWTSRTTISSILLYRYTVSTTIAPSQAAIGAGMGSDNAKQTPDQNTGTHADNNEQGFWSNDNEQSLATYRPVSNR